MAGLSLSLASAEKDLTILFGCVNCSQQNLSMTEMKTDPFSGGQQIAIDTLVSQVMIFLMVKN